MKNKKETEQSLVNKFHEGKKLEQKLEKKLLEKIKKILLTKQTNRIKTAEIFNEFFEVYHQSKLYWINKDKKNQITK